MKTPSSNATHFCRPGVVSLLFWLLSPAQRWRSSTTTPKPRSTPRPKRCAVGMSGCPCSQRTGDAADHKERPGVEVLGWDSVRE